MVSKAVKSVDCNQPLFDFFDVYITRIHVNVMYNTHSSNMRACTETEIIYLY